MSLVRVDKVTKQYGPQIVLDAVSLDVHAGQTVGVVGPNGAGKTTLFRLIAGLEAPDTGTLIKARSLRIGYLEQEPAMDRDRAVHDEIVSVFTDLAALEQRLNDLGVALAAAGDAASAELLAEYDRVQTRFAAAGGYTTEQRINEVLGGLGFGPRDYRRPTAALSAGERCRLALAKLLVTDNTFLLLDEPTNHLDIDAVRWLEKFLRGHRGGAMVISHDRYLLDEIADHIVEVDRGRVTTYRGSYSAYRKTKADTRIARDRQFKKDAEFIAKEREFIARHLAGQRTKEAQGRRARLERRITAGEFVLTPPVEDRTMQIDFPPPQITRGQVVRGSDLAHHYADKSLFQDLRLQVDAGERLGITGPNGTGKSTLLKILLGRLDPIAGTVALMPQARIGYYAQEATELDPEKTPLDLLQSAAGLSTQHARDLLAAFHFGGDAVFKQVANLSGGEQSRVRLLILLLGGADVLVLDEPTNHLDIATREALEAALQSFPGTIIAVSHDRYFLDRIAGRMLAIRPEGWETVAGNFSDYLHVVEQRPAVPPTGKPAARKNKPTSVASSQRSPAVDTSAYDSLTLDALEALLTERESELADLDACFAAPDTYRDGTALANLHRRFAALRTEIELIEHAWYDRIENQ